jgi:glycosyltransferase involved in cell wall biosynthesis
VKPLFSVLIPTYNREQHVCEAVESVLAQTWNDYEIFVIDDGSTDGTQSALAKYGSRIHSLRQANQGPEVARNHAALRAQGKYLVFLDSDDLLFPEALETYANLVQSCDAPALIIGSMTYFAEGDSPRQDKKNGSEISAVKFADFLSKDVSIGLSNSRIVIRKSVLEEMGGLRQTTPSTFHLDDFHLVLKVGTNGPCVVLMQPKTVAYRAHSANSIRDPRAMVDGILSIIDSEKKGEYPGGRERKWDRYACIGGISQLWVLRSLQARKPGQALRVLFNSAPMLAAAAYRKIRLKFCKKTPTFVISEDLKLKMEWYDNVLP